MFDFQTVVSMVLLLAVGVGIGWFLGLGRGKQAARVARDQEASAASAQYEQLRAETESLHQQVAQYRTQSEGLREQLAYVQSQLANAQQAEQLRIDHERERLEKQAEREKAEQEIKLNQESAVIAALAPVQKNLDTLASKVAQIEEGRKAEMGMLSEQLKGLGESQIRLDQQTSSLAAALRDNKVRGAWGEAQLKNIVESAGLLEHVDFDVQVVLEGDENSTQRPDMVIHLPGGKTIPIDAKVPYSSYQRACAIPDTASAEDLVRKKELLKAHAKALRDHVNALSARAYWNALKTAPDFVIAFIPNEALLQAALDADPSLMDDAFSKRVALTSPVTLWAVLKSVAYAWQQQALTEDAKELFDISRELYERFAVLGSHANALGTSIARVVANYNKFATTLESRVLVSARKLQKLDQDKIINSLDMIPLEKADVRELSAPELSENDE